MCYLRILKKRNIEHFARYYNSKIQFTQVKSQKEIMKGVFEISDNLAADDAYEGRCAEVFITQKNIFILHCSLCEMKYGNFQKLLEHILTEHYEKAAKSVMLTNLCKGKINEPDENVRKDEINNRTETNLGYEEMELLICQKSSEAEYESEEFLDESLCESPVLTKDFCLSQCPDNSEESKTSAPTTSNPKRSQRKPTKKYSDITTPMKKRTYKKKLPDQKSNDERRYKCDHCGYAYTEEYNLRAHLRRVNGVKQFECMQCPSKFHTRTELAVHERRHTGEKPYICSQCGVAFVSSGKLNEHTKRHNNNRPHKCDYCDKSFYDTFQLKEHLVVHTQERNHICVTCNAKFTRHKSLMVHRKLHENARQYVCNICSIGFNQRQALLFHKKTKHKIMPYIAKHDILDLHDVQKEIEEEDYGDEEAYEDYDQDRNEIENNHINISCLQCDLNFSTVNDLLMHEQQSHLDAQHDGMDDNDFIDTLVVIETVEK